MTRAVFLDRDGVLNRVVLRNGLPHPPSDPSELEILEGVPEAVALLHAADFRLVVVSNQPDVARGKQTKVAVEAMNESIMEQLELDEVRVCYHDDDDHCDCRKPRPGMLIDSAKQAGIDLRQSYMIGDRWRDVEAGRSAGCMTILIDNGYEEGPQSAPDLRVSSLLEAAGWILSRESEGAR